MTCGATETPLGSGPILRRRLPRGNWKRSPHRSPPKRGCGLAAAVPGLLRPDSDPGLDLSLDLAVDVRVHGRSDPE